MIQAIRAGLSRRTRRLIPARLLRIRTIRRFARGKDGIAAVEFGMVAAPFLALMFAIMETAIVFFASQTLETAVADSRAPHHDRPGAEPEASAQTQFKQAVCAQDPRPVRLRRRHQDRRQELLRRSRSINNCQADRRERQSADRISAIDPGKPGDIVVVRLMYEWPIYVSLLGFNLADMSGSKRLIIATAAFRNEPYQ